MTETTEQSKASKWGTLISDLSDAVAWIEKNCLRLPDGAHVSCNPGYPVAIQLGYFSVQWGGMDKHHQVAALFAGKEATKTVSDNGDEEYVVVDDGLKFRWCVWPDKSSSKSRTETVTL